jgi:hypothetical protein
VRKIEDPFNLILGVVGLAIVKVISRIRRGIKEVCNSLISFNLEFLASKPSIESSSTSPIALWILEIWDGHISFKSTSQWDFPFLFFWSLLSTINFLESLSKTTL